MAASDQQPPGPSIIKPPEIEKEPWYKSQIVLLGMIAALMALVVGLITVGGFTFNSRFNTMNSRFNGVDNQLIEIRTQLNDVSDRTSRIEGRLGADVLDESGQDEPEQLASEAPQ